MLYLPDLKPRVFTFIFIQNYGVSYTSEWKKCIKEAITGRINIGQL